MGQSTIGRAMAAMVLSACCLANPADAGAVSEPERLIQGFDIPALKAIASELGYQSEDGVWKTGEDYLAVKTPKGAITLTPTACTDTRCAGLDIVASFGRVENFPIAAVNNWNVHRSFTKALSVNGTLMLQRYEIADFGVPRGGIWSSLENFIASADDFHLYAENVLSGASASLPAAGTSAGFAPLPEALGEDPILLMRGQDKVYQTPLSAR